MTNTLISCRSLCLPLVASAAVSRYDGTNVNFAYTYDALGNITKITENGVAEYTLCYFYDETGVVGFEYNGVKYHYIKNLQGDIVSIYNNNGIVVVNYTYDAWGNVISITGTQATTIGEINPFRYRGYYYDTETNWYFLQSRYYDSSVGRFINADGIVGANGGVVGYNMFAYCNNNPIPFSDRTGYSLTTSLQPVALKYPLIRPTMSLEDLNDSNIPLYARGWTSPVDRAYYHNDVWFAAYGSPRDGGRRTHKGVDFYPYDSGTTKYGSDGTPQNVYAVQSGVVCNRFHFYAGTDAIVIDHGGVYVLYGEISSSLQVGDVVERGELVGSMARSNAGTLMLHLEVFVGEFGSYSRNHECRVNPTFTYSLPDRNQNVIYDFPTPPKKIYILPNLSWRLCVVC